MSAAAVITLITQVIANLPTIITTGEQVIALVNQAFVALKDAVGDRDVTPDEIREIVAKIIANSAEIQAID